MISPIQQAYQLLKKSLLALRPMKSFILMPSICSLLDLLILGAILTPIHRLEMLQQPLSKLQWEYFTLFFLLYLVFLYLTHLIFFFSHATLLNGLNAQIQGEKPLLIKALAKTIKCYPAIFWWVTFASTLGFVFLLARPWIRKFEKLEKRLSGQTWGIASYFVIPVLLEENLKPLDALERSSTLMTQTWGSPVMPRFRSIGILATYFFLCLIPLFISILFSLKTATIIGATLSSILVFILSIAYISARTLLMGSLYQYAMGQKTPLGQKPELLKAAFIPAPDLANNQ